jgi:hypothetical protein
MSDPDEMGTELITIYNNGHKREWLSASCPEYFIVAF